MRKTGIHRHRVAVRSGARDILSIGKLIDGNVGDIDIACAELLVRRDRVGHGVEQGARGKRSSDDALGKRREHHTAPALPRVLEGNRPVATGLQGECLGICQCRGGDRTQRGMSRHVVEIWARLGEGDHEGGIVGAAKTDHLRSPTSAQRLVAIHQAQQRTPPPELGLGIRCALITGNGTHKALPCDLERRRGHALPIVKDSMLRKLERERARVI